MNNELHILGCGSALPTFQNSPACQVLELCDKSFMIDCGEGSQIWFRRMALKTARLYNIFISHLHGDHCFGLIGLISTFAMMGRTQPLHIYAPADLERLLQPWLDYHCEGMSYEVIFHTINPRKCEVIYEDLPQTVEGLAQYSAPSQRFADLAGKLSYNANGEVVFAFGKYKDVPVSEVLVKDSGYYGWIMNGDFPQTTKNVIANIKLQQRLKKGN